MIKYLRKTVNGRKKYLHRYVMEEHLGRKLENNEHVYHINGDHLDNRLENLTVVIKNKRMGNRIKVPIKRVKNSIVAVSRMKMEEWLQRPLDKNEMVFHRNGNMLDNQIENLVIIKRNLS